MVEGVQQGPVLVGTFFNADGSIPSYLYDLDDEEAPELFGACTPQDTDEEGSVESAEQGNRARASIPS